MRRCRAQGRSCPRSPRSGHTRTELALAIGSVESAHRVHARLYAIDAGVITGVPNNIGFQQAKFASAGKAVSALRAIGFIAGGGQRITYPGPGPTDNNGINHLTP